MNIVNIESLLSDVMHSGDHNKMHHVIKTISKHIDNGKPNLCLQIELYKDVYGSHFNKETLMLALDSIGGMKYTCDDIDSKLKSLGIKMPEDLTIEDVNYAVHMMYSDYKAMHLADSQYITMGFLYCTDEDYPICNGKAFTEWAYKVKLSAK